MQTTGICVAVVCVCASVCAIVSVIVSQTLFVLLIWICNRVDSTEYTVDSTMSTVFKHSLYYTHAHTHTPKCTQTKSKMRN